MLKDKIESMRKSEILNLYHSFNEKTCNLELDEVDKIVKNNFKIFEKIHSNILIILDDIKRYKKNDDFLKIMNFYNEIVKDEYFSILLSKVLLISFNDIDNSGTNFDDNEEKFLKKQSDIINFIKEKI
jgi:succinylglutamate desuccinylase